MPANKKRFAGIPRSCIAENMVVSYARLELFVLA